MLLFSVQLYCLGLEIMGPAYRTMAGMLLYSVQLYCLGLERKEERCGGIECRSRWAANHY